MTLNPENCPTFAKMAYQYKWCTECSECDIESWKFSNICKKWLLNISEVLNARNVTLNPENCPTFAQMADEYKWSTECEECDIESGKLSDMCKNGLSI